MHQEFRIESLNAFLFVLSGLLISFVIFMLVFSVGDLAQAPLYAWIVCNVIAVLAKVRHREKFSKRKSRELHGKDTFQVSFICLTSIISVAAVLVFMLLPTTNKTLAKTKNVSLRDFSTGITCGIFCLPLLSLWVRFLSCL